MSGFAGMQDMLQDYLTEAGGLLDSVDRKLMMLEKSPVAPRLCNEISRGFHTLKGGAGFLEVTALVDLCHIAEKLLERLHSGNLAPTPAFVDAIHAITGAIRGMFNELRHARQPAPAAPELLRRLQAAMDGEPLMILPANAA